MRRLTTCRYTREIDALLQLGLIVLSKTGRPKYNNTQGLASPTKDIWAITRYGGYTFRLGARHWTKTLSGSPHEAEKPWIPNTEAVGLLERIIAASSDKDDTILDPFCGCGTTVHAAQKLNRRWIGIDITHLAISLVKRRLIDAFPMAQFEIHGVPKDLGAARELAKADPHQFQLWALSMIEAQPYKGGKKGADSGIDGFLYFKPDGKTTEKAVIEVKGGENVSPQWVRALGQVVERERAKVGVLS